jgi:hypothetical protein
MKLYFTSLVKTTGSRFFLITLVKLYKCMNCKWLATTLQAGPEVDGVGTAHILEVRPTANSDGHSLNRILLGLLAN